MRQDPSVEHRVWTSTGAGDRREWQAVPIFSQRYGATAGLFVLLHRVSGNTLEFNNSAKAGAF